MKMHPSPAPEPLLRVREIAELWRCSEHHARDLIADGELAATALGPRYSRIPEPPLADHVRKHTDPAPRGLRAAA